MIRFFLNEFLLEIIDFGVLQSYFGFGFWYFLFQLIQLQSFLLYILRFSLYLNLEIIHISLDVLNGINHHIKNYSDLFWILLAKLLIQKILKLILCTLNNLGVLRYFIFKNHFQFFVLLCELIVFLFFCLEKLNHVKIFLIQLFNQGF